MQPAFAQYQGLIQSALAEDMGKGDITSEMLVPDYASATAFIRTREDITLCGLNIAIEIFGLLGVDLAFMPKATDGDRLKAGDTIIEIRGSAPPIVVAERTALNMLQYLSGIATITRKYVDAVHGTGAHILDTRKTLPGYRNLAKYAVRMGGGKNHRMGLDDGILIKDNHIAIAGSVTQAINSVAESAPHMLKIEIECENIAQVKEAVASGEVNIIMLDNMPIAAMVEAVNFIRQESDHINIEASGNINLNNVKAVAETGVDYISIGGITHSSPAVDIGLDIDIEL